jgi:23S rRNA (adenine1618-N6)-methyltransferase
MWLLLALFLNIIISLAMTSKHNPVQEEKDILHPRNPHRFRYDFAKLIQASPELGDFVFTNDYDYQSVDFNNPEAVKALNRSLLKHFYHIDFWDVPEGYLCPPIPGRADYIHYAADLLGSLNGGVIPRGKAVKILDIGVGANCVYPIIGFREYGWSFVGTDIDHLAIRSAKNIIEANGLTKAIEVRKQLSANNVFEGMVKPGEKFHLSICNPPFHSSSLAADAGTQRKWKNLGQKGKVEDLLNFGGQQNELSCEGGEEGFLKRMILESGQYAGSFNWFSTLVSKKSALPGAYHQLKHAGAADVRTIDMAQGQKVSRILAWTFLQA